MKSYLKYNHYLLLGTFIILCAQLMWEVLYKPSIIYIHINKTFIEFPLPLLFFVGAFSIGMLFLGLFYWKIEQRKKLHFQLKYLHINLTLISSFIIFLFGNVNSMIHDRLQKTITIYDYFPFVNFNDKDLHVFVFIFILAQLFFVINLLKTIIFTKPSKTKIIEDIDHLIIK